MSFLQEKDQNDLKSLTNCRKSYKFTDIEWEQLENLSLSHIRRSEELLKSGNLNSAIVSLERAVEINPFSDEFRNKLAQIYLMRSQKEGFKKTDRDLAFTSASLSLKINSSNPIAKSILKEIQKKDDKISGRDLHKKLLPLLLAIFIIALAAIFLDKEYVIPFFNNTALSEEEEWEKPPALEKIPFSEREIDTQINSLNDQFEISISRSTINKTNGSYSYTIQGEIGSVEKALKSLDLEISFINVNREKLFTKTFSMIKENQIIMPGEKVLVDYFFYIHYLPPEIDKITLNLSNIDYAEDIISQEESQIIALEWTAARPEGIKISLILKEEITYETYSQYYKNMKILMKNSGFTDIKNLEVSLSWRDQYGTILYENQKILINKSNPPLQTEDDRIFNIFSEIPKDLDRVDTEFFLRINRIN